MKRLSVLTVALLLTSCAQIIGLEARDLVDAGAADGATVVGSDGGTPVSADCARYCDDARELCTADAGLQLFSTDETCRAVCEKFSKSPDPSSNTLACRQSQLAKLRAGGALEARTYCPGAGAGGGAPEGELATAGCGTDCEGFCALRQSVCDPKVVEPGCVEKCRALPISQSSFNATADFGSGSDTLQCRIAHLSAAGLYLSRNQLGDRDGHCGHSGIKSTGPCNIQKADPSCKDFCKIATSACTGDAQIYENVQQCEAFCAKLTPGSAMDTQTVGTVRCLREGAYDALQFGARFCPNAGPGPEQCGRGRCESYCLLAQKACPTKFAAQYPGMLPDCEATCGNLVGAKVGDAPYAAVSGQARLGDNLHCRLLRVTRALAGDTSDGTCSGAVGAPGSECK